MSGGNDKNTYFFSLSNLQQEGIIRESRYDRTNIRFNYNASLNDWMELSNKVAYAFTDSNATQGNSNVGGIQLGHLRTPADFDNRDYIGVYTSASGEEFLGDIALIEDILLTTQIQFTITLCGQQMNNFL